MKKAAKNRRNQHSRARAERRSRARATKKAAGRRRVHAIVPTNGSAPHFFDDCPICRAMQDVGARPGPDGVVVMSPGQQRAYERRLDEIVAKDGWPEGTQRFDAREAERVFREVDDLLEARGYPTDIDAMSEQEQAEHMQRVMDVLGDRARAERDRAAAGGLN